jgi:hypothetical protein
VKRDEAKNSGHIVIRRFSGTVVIGLFAAMAAHAAVYGNGHVLGGAYAGAVQILSAIGAAFVVGLWFAVGWASKGISNGSIVKTRLGELLPSWPSITAAAVVWFSVVESLEHDGHADAPASVLIAAIVVFSFLARALGRAFLQVLSDAVFGDRGLAPKSRMPGWTMTAAVPVAPRASFGRARVARPPPNSPNRA